MILQHIIDIIESAVPLKWQEEWDNSGLQVGEPDAEIRAVLLAVDVTEQVMDEAVRRGCNLILSHHPLIFKGIKSLTGATPQERCVLAAVRNRIAVYSSHTAVDSWLHGVSGGMAVRCGVENLRILIPAADGADHGLGVIGTLPEPLPFEDFLDRVRTVFGAPMLRYILPARGRDRIRTAAFCGGAGASFIPQAMAQGADIYVTADCKYHEMQQAVGRMAVIDLDHWVSEHFVREVFLRLLEGKVPVMLSEEDGTPVQVA